MTNTIAMAQTTTLKSMSSLAASAWVGCLGALHLPHTPYPCLPGGSTAPTICGTCQHTTCCCVHACKPAAQQNDTQGGSRILFCASPSRLQARCLKLEQLIISIRSAKTTAVDCTAQCMQTIVTTAGHPTGLSALQVQKI